METSKVLFIFRTVFLLAFLVHIKYLFDVVPAFMIFPTIHFSFVQPQMWNLELQQKEMQNFIKTDVQDQINLWERIEIILIISVTGDLMLCMSNIISNNLKFRIIHIICSWINAILYWFIFFYEKSLYNNHHYLYGIILSIFAISSLFSDKNMQSKYTLKILQYQISIVYLFAGLTKLNSFEWIFDALPIRIWFFDGTSTWSPFLWRLEGYINYSKNELFDLSLTNSDFELYMTIFSYIMSYYSLFIDLFGGIILLFSRNTLLIKLTLIFLNIFHLCNFLFFDIGTFPIVMLSTTLLWWIPCYSFHPINLFDILKIKVKNIQNTIIIFLLLFFIVFQFIFPLRFILFTNDINWTKDSHYFSWRMMINHEETLTKWIAIDSSSNSQLWIDSYVNDPNYLRIIPHQRQVLGYDPPLMQQFAREHVLPIVILQHNVSLENTRVYVNSWRSLNGKPFQRWIKPDLDLLYEAKEYCLFSIICSHSNWIVPKINQIENKYNTWRDIRKHWNRNSFDIVLFSDIKNENFTATFKNFAEEFEIVIFEGEIKLYSYEMDSSIIPKENQKNNILSLPFGTISVTTLSEYSVFGFAYKGATMSFAEAILM